MNLFHRGGSIAATMSLLVAFALATGTFAWSQTPGAQPSATPPSAPSQFRWPDRLQNARVLPRSTTSEELRETMRGFAISLGVRCSHCHVGTEQMPLAERDFPSDANPRKDVARGMMRMVARLNRDIRRVVGRDARVTCYTCHRGAATPATQYPMPTPPPARTPAS